MKPKYALLSLILLPLLLLSCEGRKNEATNNKTLAVSGKIIQMEGDAQIDGVSAEIGDIVKEGAVLVTGPESYCEVQFLGANVIRIFEDSIIRISFADATVNLDKGAAAAVLRNIGSLIRSMDDVFSIKSGTVVAGIRGTSFYVKREDADSTYFCLCNGEIVLNDSSGSFTQPMTGTHHNAVRISGLNRQLEVSKAPMLYHDDALMEALAASIGEKMDWDRIEGRY